MPLTPFVNLSVYLFSFFLIWIGAGLIISSVDKYSKRLNLSKFIFSFLILGLLTSIPEFSIGLTALSEEKPDIFVGNLLGGVVVMFLLVIPLLAILGNGVKIDHGFDGKNLVITLAAIATPALFVSDGQVSNLEGALLILFYCSVIFLVQRKNGVIENLENAFENLKPSRNLLLDAAKLIVGIALVFVTSNIILEKTLYFSDLLKISPFVMSLVFLSIGTNLPELSLAIRSVLQKKEQIAFGDYMGSASANTLLFGIFTILNNGEVLTKNGYLITFVFILFGLVMFYSFAQTKHTISRIEGVVMLSLYGIFILFELLK